MLKQSTVSRGKRWIIAGLLAVAGTAGAAELNTLKRVDVAAQPRGARVVVEGSRTPMFTVFRLNGPDRLVVDLTSADASAIKGHHDGHGPITGIVATQFSDERSSVARVLLALGAVRTYDVRAEGNRVVIQVDGTGGSAAVADAAPVVPAPTLANAPPTLPPESVKGASIPAQAPESPRGLGENVIAMETDEQDVSQPATRLVGIRAAGESIFIQLDGEIARYDVLELANPARLAVDLHGVSLAAKMPKLSGGAVREIRAGEHDGKVRLVLDVRGKLPEYLFERGAKGLELSLGSRALSRRQAGKQVAETAVAVIEPAPVAASKRSEAEPLRPVSAPVAVTAPAPITAPLVDVKDVSFDESVSGGRVAVKLSGEVKYEIERPDANSAILTLKNARIAKKLERSFDTSALETPVKMISTFAVPGDVPSVRIVVAAAGPLEQTVAKAGDGLRWNLSVKGVKTEEVSVAAKSAPLMIETPTITADGVVKQRRYTGRRVNFEFKDIDIQNLLRVMAEISKKNIVVADDVSGKVTIRLRNVPWDQALELILRSKGLGKEEFGNIVRVAPLSTLEAEAKLRAERQKSLQAQAPLIVQLLPVNYAIANDMQARVKEILSERGTVAVDARTNVLIVKDSADNVDRARRLIASLDLQTPQVLIESRIVEANTSFSRQLGVQWGGQATAAQATGNATGLVFPNSVAVTGGSLPGGNLGVSSTPNFAVNLPAPVGIGSGGALGFVFGSAGGALQLNLRLSAAENEGTVKTISAPKVTTLDNNTATISQGVSIPFSQVSAAGANTSFIEARLSLEVTPHITQDGSVLMTINAQNNQPDPSSTGANGQPSIQRKEAKTQVLVKDGDTTVIGGIYVRRGAQSTASVPFLSKIPVLGLLFKNHTESDARQELLIFITPRIINRQTMAQSL